MTAISLATLGAFMLAAGYASRGDGPGSFGFIIAALMGVMFKAAGYE